MSRRLLQRGRYPKGPGVEQMTNPSSQVPSTTAPACPAGMQMPYYGSSVQSETAQNSWTQPSYPNPASYQQNPFSHTPVPDTNSYWSGGQMYPASVQPPPNEQWNWKPENTVESSSYSNYQHSPLVEPWQQLSYSQVDNQNYSQPQGGYNPAGHQVYQPVADYQSGNNNTNTVVPNTPMSTWENGELNITQPEQLPWTYSAPQYCNSSYSTDFSQNSNAIPTNVSVGIVNSDQQTISTTNHVQEESSANYLSGGSANLSDVTSKMETAVSEQMETSKLEALTDKVINSSTNVGVTDGKANNPSEHSLDADYGSSTLSAFFQNRDVDNSSNNSESGVSASEIKTAIASTSLEEGVACMNLQENESSFQSEEPELDNKIDEGNLENNFLQEENLNSLDVKGGRELEPDSPIGSVEEPINQEVPEPHMSDSSKLQQKVPKLDNNELALEEPLNQQIPAESGQKSRSASCEPERIVIRPREESPFKPPRANNTSKSGAIVQQEKPTAAVQKHSETKASEGKTIVQEVNLETFPDNLERPPDYEELRKMSPLYVSHHKHLRNELNNSPSSLLCDNPDIPYVTLAPAAPPLHSSAKSDKSESSSDSKAPSNTGSLYNSVPSDKTQWPSLNESNVTTMLPSMPSNKIDVVEKSMRTSQLSAAGNVQSSEIKTTKSASPSQSKKYDPISSVGRKDEAFILEQNDQQHLFLKDSKINGNTYANNQNSDSPRKNLANVEYLEQMSNLPPSISSRTADMSSNVNNMRMDTRYPNNHLESNRQRFADQKYSSFDERQYYSDRERSRPPSGASLGERPEDYYYGGSSSRRGGPPENARPSSRMSESDLNRGDRNGQYGYYQQQYPHGYPPGYSRNAEYYQRPPNYRGYEYDPYQRDPYYASYYDAYRYAYSNFNYGFYDELYRNDPRYRQYREAQEQYRQYYAKYGYETDYDRSSIRSGRSSANELSKDMPSSRYPEPDIDSNESEFSTYNLQQNYSYDDVPIEGSAEVADQMSTPSARLTPAKYSYAHPIARFSPGGLLITVIPNQLSTALATPVTIHSLQVIMEKEESFQELKNYQGPLVRGLTHKNDVIEFCSQKIKSLKQKEDIVDRDSYVLLWELMVVLLRQNGSVAGSDIAELLLKDHEVLRPPTMQLKHAIETPQGEQSPADVNDSSSQSHAGDTSSPDEGIVVLHDKSNLNMSHTVDVDKVTRKFREFLLFGHKKDALEWAMKHGLWGHALFLASKMDLRTYANVMTRFANSLALNDPLQTLYQLMSGRQPSAVTCVADKKWGDWRPHLAMILSNPSTHPDVDSRSITTLGDTLASRGCLPAAHFCYIMAQVEFGTFEQKNSKVVLLTADHMLSFEEFATNEGIQCTEIYEYAQSLANPGYMLTHLQLYKFLYAMRLIEHGFLEEALHYCEVIAGNFQAHPNLFSLDFISEVYKLAVQLKYHDPHFLRGQGEFEEQDDPEWLKNLSILVQNYNNILQGENSNLYYEQQLEVSQNVNSGSETNPPAESSSYQNMSNTVTQNEVNNSYNYYQANSWNQQNNMLQNSTMLSNNQQDNQSMNAYYQPEMMKKFNMESSIPSHEENETTDVPSSPVTQTPPFDYYSGGTQQMMENKPSNYETVNSYSSSSPRERRDSALSTGSRYSSGSLSVANKSRESQKPEPKKEKPNTQAGKTWLGGIFSRLLPKAPNQMILPDDKNPTIVWDDVKNCWVNKDSNDDDESNAPLAPPTDMELLGTKPSEKAYTSGNSMPPMAGPLTVNKFQRPKTRVMRQNYVDILNSSGSTVKANVPAEALFPTTYDHTTSPKMFIPQSVPSVAENSTDFEQSPESYNTSQLEREEKSQPSTAPLMLDPAEFDSRSSNMGSQRHMLGRTSRRTYPT